MTTVNVRAEKGCGRFEAEFPFGGRKIFFAAKTHILRRNGVSYQVPASVAYVLNRELEKRTNGKVTHELVEQGLYHLLRLTVYAARGSSDEIEEMYARRGQIRKEASELLESGLMPADVALPVTAARPASPSGWARRALWLAMRVAMPQNG